MDDKNSFHCRQTKPNAKKKQKLKKQTTTKILVRNIPFEAKKQEIYELFKYAYYILFLVSKNSHKLNQVYIGLKFFSVFMCGVLKSQMILLLKYAIS